ncbi:MAG: S8 family serine peptidase [Ignavibacteria bacterium]|nr:S8 family serine peptidase [Ignavibacteria bacterium]
MQSLARMFLITMIGIVLLSFSAFAGDKIGARLSKVLEGIGPNDEVVVWVYFTDKGSHEFAKSSVPESVVSDRSIRRRLKVRHRDEVVDYTDLPVEQTYLDRVASHVVKVRHRSKWFNSVSVCATKNQINELVALSIVKKIELLARFKKNNSEIETPRTPNEGGLKSPQERKENYSFDYGPSLGQLAQISVPEVHNTGNYAQGVIVGVFDNGFRLLTHEAFDSLDIIATYDFVDHKVSVVPNHPGHGGHGVNTLSTIGGFKEGQLIGPAFGASYILARTENDSSETPIEEDNWVAAIEWADSIGVEVTSTSLGYLTYGPPYTSWTWEDMNGNTTVITRAADMAVARGIVVLNSAGNEGNNPSHNTLIAPADGDSVISVGAVSPSGTRVSFSSVGPTTSMPPRIKPDVMAQGSSVRVASSINPTGYSSFASGTSFSCPLAAGVTALIVHARPNATPIEIGDAMRLTASNAGSPNNLMGWGILNAVEAINFISTTGIKETPTTPTAFKLEQNFPNPFNPTTNIRYELPKAAFVTLTIYDVLGREVRKLVNERQSAAIRSLTWDGTNNLGKAVASGVYLYRLSSVNDNGETFSDARRMILLQ